MTNLISMDKKYKTRDGRDVRVLCVDNNGACAEGYPVVAIVDGAVVAFTATGGFYPDSEERDMDLIEVVQEHIVWIEVFKSQDKVISCSYETEGEMVESIQSSKNCNTPYEYTLLATKKIVVTEGEVFS